MEEKIELLKPKIDVVFHSIFKQGNEDITKAMLQAITKEEIKDIELEDRHIIGKYVEEKLGILDLRAKLDNGTICNIEIQLSNKQNTSERFLYYWSRLYSGQLEKGQDYLELHKVIGIIIIDYNFKKTKGIDDISTKWKMKETSTGKNLELTDNLEMYIIEIPKARKILEKEPNNKLAQWLMFLNDPNESGVSQIMEENKEIKKAMEELEEISKDKELRLIAELREKAIRDEKNGLRSAREDGLAEGIEKGKKAEKEEIAKAMLKEKMSVEQIAKITGLSKLEIEKLENR